MQESKKTGLTPNSRLASLTCKSGHMLLLQVWGGDAAIRQTNSRANITVPTKALYHPRQEITSQTTTLDSDTEAQDETDTVASTIQSVYWPWQFCSCFLSVGCVLWGTWKPRLVIQLTSCQALENVQVRKPGRGILQPITETTQGTHNSCFTTCLIWAEFYVQKWSLMFSFRSFHEVEDVSVEEILALKRSCRLMASCPRNRTSLTLLMGNEPVQLPQDYSFQPTWAACSLES